jgi:hypothetical protein
MAGTQVLPTPPIAPMAPPHLIAEVVQQIARDLRFADIWRCRQVSSAWYLVCVPATQKLQLAVQWKLPHQICAGRPEPVEAHLMNEDCVRMGEVADVIGEQLERAPWEMSIQYTALPLYDWGNWDRSVARVQPCS